MTDPNLSLVLDELQHAKEKHPKFVDELFLIVATPDGMDEWLETLRNSNEEFSRRGQITMRNILDEEVVEAMTAYAHGDLAHARQELAQCAAVCIRGMEYIEHEIAEQQTTKENNTNG